MRAVVTGGAGFVGSHLIEALIARGAEVLCVERPGVNRGWIEHIPIEYAETGVGDPSALAPLLDGADVVFHLAGLTHARASADYYTVNTEGTANVLRAAASRKRRPPRVVLMSSIAALGPCRNGDSLSSTTVPYPVSHYGNSKLLAEAAVHAFADRVPATILRFPSIYGPRERQVLRIFRMARRGFALTVGSWEREVSLIYVADAVRGLLAAATSPRAVGQTYCVAHPVPVSIAGFATAVGLAMGRVPRLVSIPEPVVRFVAMGLEACAWVRRSTTFLNRQRLSEVGSGRWVCDPSRATAELDFHADTSLRSGVDATAAWYREVRWL
jgi:nucleoside-diphosphate-sugar epimerase